MQSTAPIHRIVLTGGPCGGKSTALIRISERMKTHGLDVYRVPEAATIVMGGGAHIRGMNPDQRTIFQTHLLNVIMTLENSFHGIARVTGRPSILLCDRGTMDCAAYMTAESWAAMLAENNWSIEHLRDHRYDAVIHLVTAAAGAEPYYTTANNAVRMESPEEARRLDARALEAWKGHPLRHVVDNSTDFDGKVERAVAAVCAAVGITGAKTNF